MESNINITTPNELIVKCPTCKRKFHKDNLAGHLMYEKEIEASDPKQNNVTAELKLDELKKCKSSLNPFKNSFDAILEDSKDAESV